MENDESFQFTIDNGGLFVVTDSATRYAGLFFTSYAQATVIEVSDPENRFVVSDTDSGNLMAVFTSSNSHVVTIKNYTNIQQQVRVYAMGDISAATAIS